MKRITYNPTSALSILLAAVAIAKFQAAEVLTTDKNGSDFESRFKEVGLSLDSTAYRFLTDHKEEEKGVALAFGILAEHHDLSKFESILFLNKMFQGDNSKFEELVSKGSVINKFVESPAFLKSLSNK